MTAGLVYVGRVVGTDPGGPRVIVPELGGNSAYGPLPCAVPDLAVGETVVVTSLGTSRDQLVVLGRMAGRAPDIDEVPGLTAAITAVNGRVDVVVTDQDADQVTLGLHGTRITGVENVNTTQNGRLNTAETTIGGHTDTLGTHGTRLTATEGVANGASSGLTTLRADTAGKTTTKGDLLAATAAGVLARQGAPANGLALVADSAQTTGWIGKDLLGMPKALTGAVAATRYAGGTATGAPSTGTWAIGDFIVDQTGNVWVCTVAGTPGTWKSPSSDLRAELFGSATRTKVPYAIVKCTADYNYTTAQGDLFAQGGWTDTAQTDTGMIVQPGVGGNVYTYAVPPITGRYAVRLRLLATASTADHIMAIKVTRNGTAVGTTSIATDAVRTTLNSGESGILDAYCEEQLTAGDKLYWGNWGNANYSVRSTSFGAARTFFSLRWLGST